MPPKAEVLVVEDDNRWQENYARMLPGGGHSVAATVRHIFDAADAIHDLKESGARIDVAIVDGNLGRSNYGEDGSAVVFMLRRDFPDAKILGITSDPNGVAGADVNLNKATMNPMELAGIVTRL